MDYIELSSEINFNWFFITTDIDIVVIGTGLMDVFSSTICKDDVLKNFEDGSFQISKFHFDS